MRWSVMVLALACGCGPSQSDYRTAQAVLESERAELDRVKAAHDAAVAAVESQTMADWIREASDGKAEDPSSYDGVPDDERLGRHELWVNLAQQFQLAWSDKSSDVRRRFDAKCADLPSTASLEQQQQRYDRAKRTFDEIDAALK